MPSDVVVVGGGNAGLCAALSAREAGASRVVLLERAPEAQRGGNSYFSGGLFRFPYDDGRGLIEIAEVSPQAFAGAEFRYYGEEEFYTDLCRVTNYRTDPELANALVSESCETMRWLRDLGVRFELQFSRQSFVVRGKHRFEGGAIVAAIGGGAGLIDSLYEAARRRGIEVRYGARARALLLDGGAVRGVRVQDAAKTEELHAHAVVLACGGFEANPQWRARYLGAGWDLALVRGTPYNTGDGIAMAMDAGALPYGHWSGCHAVSWDANAPPFGDRKMGDLFSRHSYTLGIMVNKHGCRFVDEGADLRVYTYAKYGHLVLAQPDQIAYQIFDQKVLALLRDDYRASRTTRVEAQSIEELAAALEIDARMLAQTIAEYNAAAGEQPFDPSRKDGKSTRNLDPPKSNWAQRLDAPPFVAYPVTCGITYTFGGVRVAADGRVLDARAQAIPGLFACGELIGGLFYHNYPGGTGLMAGSVFGRQAGKNALN